MAHTPDLPHFFEENINLEGLFDILSPKNNLVLADDMMLSDADGIILRVSENYERNFGFTHDSIVGKSAFDLEADGTFSPCITAEVIRQKKKITATQTINHTHKNVMTVGIPLFDQNGVLKYAVCFNTVSMEQINTIQQNYRHLQDSLQQYTQEIAELRLRATATDLVVKSPAMQRLWTLILNTANTKANILITGETGVGKSAVAKAIHAISNRANGPFIEVNCAVLHENLIESELFGYEKGAFTGAASAGKIGKIELATVPCFWMRSENCRLISNPSCCSSFRKRPSSGCPAPSALSWISACWWPPTAIWRRRCSGGCSVRTFSTG